MNEQIDRYRNKIIINYNIKVHSTMFKKKKKNCILDNMKNLIRNNYFIPKIKMVEKQS